MKAPNRLAVLIVVGGMLVIDQSRSSTLLAHVDTPGQDDRAAPTTTATLQTAYGNLPLSFIQNKGQVDKGVLFYEQGSGHATALLEDRIQLSLVNGQRSDTISLVPLGGNKKATIVGEGLLEGTVNYFVGRDHTKWRTGIPTYQAIVYQEIYPSIDLKFYGNQRQLEYDVIVKPGADPSKITFAYEGIKALRVTEEGDLEIGLEDGKVYQQKKPVAYQDINGTRVAVEAGFKVLDTISAGGAAKRAPDKTSSPSARHDAATAVAYAFEVTAYDKTHPLIIDPVLVRSAYLGGSNDEGGTGFGPEFPAALDAAIEADAFGHAYVTGATTSLSIGLTSGQWGSRGGHDAFVAKLNRTGTELVYATYLGGSGYDGGHAIAIDPSGHVYLTGETASPDFPTTPGAYDRQCGTDGACNGGRYDAFVVKLDPDGVGLAYSTYLGGSGYDDGHDIAVNSAGNIYVTGTTAPEPPATPDFPTTVGALAATYQGGWTDAFVAKLEPDESNRTVSCTISDVTYNDCADLVSSTFLGGSGRDLGGGIALDLAGNIYVTGSTTSQLSGLAPDVVYGTDTTCGTEELPCSATGALDGYVAQLNADGRALRYWAYLGGRDVDHSFGIDLVGGWKVYVTGRTSSPDFPTTAGAFDRTYNGDVDQFVAVLNTADRDGTRPLAYSTFLGGAAAEDGHNLVLDRTSDSVYVNGGTTSSDFPTKGDTEDAVDSTCGTGGTCNAKDGYLVRLRADNTNTNVPCEISGITYNDCNDLLYSTYLGGSGEDIAHGVAVDGWGNVYATGRTASSDFPSTAGAHSGGATDAFVATVGRTPQETANEAAALPIVGLHFHADRHWDLDGDSDYEDPASVFDNVGVVRACGGETHPVAGSDSLALGFAGDLPARYYPYGGMFGLRQLTAEQLTNGDVPGNLNEDIRTYLDTLESRLRMGSLSGIGEVFPDNRHSHPDDPDPAHYPYNLPSYYPADSPLMQRLWALSAAFQIPLDVHMEATQESVAQMERLLDMEFDGRKGIWLWAHAGHYDKPSGFWELLPLPPYRNFYEKPPAEPSTAVWLSRLLTTHENLYIEFSYRDFRQYWEYGVVDYNTGKLKPEWKDLLEAHSDRFVIGTDVDAADPKQYAMLITFWRGVLAQLAPEAAANIAYRNAQGLTIPEKPEPAVLCGPRAPSEPSVSRTVLSNMPADQTLLTPSGTGMAVTYAEPTATDDMGVASVICSPFSGSVFLGVTTVTCTATDTAGNSSSARFAITVLTDIDADGVADVNDSCPADPTNTCDTNGSTARMVDAGIGGTLTTPDGSVSVAIPPRALAQDTTLSITHTGSMFELATDLGQVLGILGVEILPEGTVFAVPITLVFTWPDADNDGVVDGTSLAEEDLRITKDAVTITGRCQDESGCDPAANTFRVTVSSLSVFVLNGPLNRPPTASAGVDQRLECAGATCPIILDASGSTDPDSSAGTQDDIAEYRWYEDYGTPQQLLLGTGQVLVVILDVGVHAVTLEVTDQSGVVGTDTVAITLDPAHLSLFVVEKAEVDWRKHADHLTEVKLHGRLALPSGLLVADVAAMAVLTLDLGDQPGVLSQQVVFETRDGRHEQWQYRARPSGAGIERMSIHWRGAKFDYRSGGLRLKTEFIAADAASLTITREDTSAALILAVNGVTVSIDAAGVVPSSVPYEVDEDGEITFTLPFELTPDLAIEVTVGGQPPTTILVGDYYTPAGGKFEVEARVETGDRDGTSLPASLVVTLALGNEGFSGSTTISDLGWRKRSHREWKAHRND